MKKRNTIEVRRGFTLIELLVVVLIIGILAAVAVPQYQLATDKSRYIELMSLVKNIQEMQEIYFLANSRYATDCAELGIDLPTNTILDDDKQIKEEKKGYTVACNSDNSVVGQFPAFGGNKGSLAYIRKFQQTNYPGLITCFASKSNIRSQRVCNSLCGPLTTNTAGKLCRLVGSVASDDFSK